MCKTTLLLAGLSIVLAGALGTVVWKLTQHPNQHSTPPTSDVMLQLGLPGVAEHNGQPPFRSGSILLYDTDAQVILHEQNGFERKPIASITKLMTAMIALDHTDEWRREIAILPEEYVQGGNLTLHAGETITMYDALAVSLVGSANNTTLALVRELGIPKGEFIQEMNRKAIELGLEQTEFVDVTGLDPGNISTAYEVALLANTAFSQYPDISNLTSREEYTFTIGGSGREHTVKNTNKLIREWGIPVSGSKTGYLYESRFCLVVQGTGEYANRIGVVLDGPSEVEHLADMKKLLSLPAP